MKPVTERLLFELGSEAWFRSVGQRDVVGVVCVSTWEQAVTLCDSDDWQNLLLDAANDYVERLRSISKDYLRYWNEVVRDIRPVVARLVRKKIDGVVNEFSLPVAFRNTVEWDMLHAALEAEYAEVCPTGFFFEQKDWYLRGHFPCGWNGTFPEGTRVIF